MVSHPSFRQWQTWDGMLHYYDNKQVNVLIPVCVFLLLRLDEVKINISDFYLPLTTLQLQPADFIDISMGNLLYFWLKEQ